MWLLRSLRFGCLFSCIWPPARFIVANGALAPVGAGHAQLETLTVAFSAAGSLACAALPMLHRLLVLVQL